MKEKSLTKNSIFYLIYNLLNVLFPFFTGIYVARVLLPENVGQVEYASNIVQYFVILAFLGIPTYGMREVARCRDDREKLDRLFSELFFINLASTALFSVVYFSLIFLVPKFSQNIPLYLIVGVSLILNAINTNWLFEGVEEFTYISTRNIVIKVVIFLLLVWLVRGPEDYLWYAFITAFGTAANYIVNLAYAGRHIRFTTKGLSFRRHMKPILYLVVVNLAIEIYTLVDKTMIGSMCDDTRVAIYSYASRIHKILLHIVNSFTMVVVPRLSAVYKKKLYDDFNALLSKTFLIIVILSLPMIVGLQFTAKPLMRLIYGGVYEQSAIVLCILCLNLLISPVGYLLGSRVMLVTGNEKRMVYCVGIGAVVNVIGNYFLIRGLREVGASIASVISEIAVMAVYLAFSHKKFRLVGVAKSLVKVAAACAAMALWLYAAGRFVFDPVLFVVVSISAAVVLYFGVLLLLKEENTASILKKLLKKLHLAH